MRRAHIDQRAVDFALRPITPYEDVVTLAGRTQVSTWSIPRTALNIIFVGQSTNHNSLNGTTTVSNGSHIYNLSIGHRGSCFTAVEPLLTSDLTGGHHGMSLADQLIADNTVDDVVLTSIALGGSYCAHWNPAGGTTGADGAVLGVFAYRIGLAARCIYNAGLWDLPTIIDWQQGEKDTTGTATTEANYAAALAGVIAEFKKVGLLRTGTRMLINKCTLLSAASGDRNAIKAAQAGVVDNVLVYLGADIDSLDTSNRYDNVHFTVAGAAAQAALKKVPIAAYVAAL